MNAITKAQNAYRNDAHMVRTGRDTEYDAFARVTHRLKSASASRVKQHTVKEL